MSFDALTPRSRRSRRRPDIDRGAVRYFVYRLLDADGVPLYIGRSCDVAARLRAHHSDANHQYDQVKASKAFWLFQVRSVSMVGPFTWADAVRRERSEIEVHQPVGNRDLTARDRRPAVAARSARRSA